MEPSITLTLKNKKNFIYHKKQKWIKLTATYKANGTEKYLTIGYLTPDNEVEYRMIRKSAKNAYMSLDSINLVPMGAPAACNLEQATRQFFGEQRRHHFNVPCGEQAFNLFPFLLREAPAGNTEADTLLKQPEERQTRIWRNLAFNINEASLMAQAFPVIDSLIEDLGLNSDLQVKIIGHTDNSGNPEYNRTLSEQRARAVADYITDKGISRSRITPMGLGDTQPIADNTSESGRAMNRRVEFEFYYAK